MKYSIHNSRSEFNWIEVFQSEDKHGHRFRTVAEFLNSRIDDEDVQIVQNTSYDQDSVTVQLPEPEEIANAFIAVLRAWLTPKEMQQIRDMNRKETDSGVCHSHDFCDSNMAMDKAFSLHSINISLESDEHTKLWNTAWDIAKTNNFNFINS